MSQYPVDTEDNLVEAVNYLLSGPVSSGQNFEGMNAVSVPANKPNGTNPATFFTGATLPGPYTFNANTVSDGTTPPDWSLLDTTPFGGPAVNFSIANIVPVLPGVTNECTFTPTVGTIPASSMFVGRVFLISGFSGSPPTGFDGYWKVTSWTAAAGFIIDINMEYPMSGLPETFPPYPGGGSADSQAINIEISNITQSGQFLTVDVTVPGYPNTISILNEMTAVPFAVGQIVEISGVNPSAYDQQYLITDVTGSGYIHTLTLFSNALAGVTLPAYTSGGIVFWDKDTADVNSEFGYFTDCQAIVSVTGPTDRVFLSNQLSLSISTFDVAPAVTLYVRINRFKALEKTTFPAGLLTAMYNGYSQLSYQGYIWGLDTVVIELQYDVSDPTFDGNIILSNVIDSPDIGYYWYTVNLDFGFMEKVAAIMPYGLRSFTAQVIKR